MRFRLKITICMLCLVSILLGAGSTALIFLSFQSGLEREKSAAGNSWQMLMYTLQIAGDRGFSASTENIQETLGKITGQRENYWDSVLLSQGEKVLYSQGAVAEYLSLKEEEGNEGGVISFFRTEPGADYLRISGTFTAGGRDLRLSAAHDITDLYENRRMQQNTYHAIFILSMVLCAGISYGMARLLTRPLDRLSRGTRELARGNLSFRSGIRSEDEVGRLAADFDRMADQIQKNVRELERAMERQEQFMGSFTHELKTPMTAVIGYADLLRSQELTEEERRDAANFIFSEARRLERLSLKLLDIYVAEQTQLQMSRQRPGRIVRDIAAHMRPALEEQGIHLNVRCQKGSCILEPDLFRSLIVNLIDNAGKALSQSRGNRVIQVTLSLTDRGCRLVIEDNGPGIPEEAREHLTEAFYRVDKSRSRRQGGAGLGLTLCARIVELHGGYLFFENREQGGARVIALLNSGREEDQKGGSGRDQRGTGAEVEG